VDSILNASCATRNPRKGGDILNRKWPQFSVGFVIRLGHIMSYSTFVVLVIYVVQLRSQGGGLKKIYDDGDGVSVYEHMDSMGMTESIRDSNRNGKFEYHEYNIMLNSTYDLSIRLVNNEEGPVPSKVAFFLVSKSQKQRGAALVVGDVDEFGRYQACTVSFLGKDMKKEIVYSDWDLDGRIDSEVYVEKHVTNVLFKNQWVPIVPDRPYKFPEYVTVNLNGVETRLEFVNGAFQPVLQ
jgi:hypothetical protein